MPIGESWEVVDREDAQSVVHNGPYRGTTLHELWTSKREEIFGNAYVDHAAPRFPILIKLLDARERLSIQVHPPMQMSATLGGEPKTEMWYFADTQPGANIYVGLKAGVTRSNSRPCFARAGSKRLFTSSRWKMAIAFHPERPPPRHWPGKCHRRGSTKQRHHLSSLRLESHRSRWDASQTPHRRIDGLDRFQ